MSTLIQWSGDGLSGNLTTLSAGPGDTAPSFITGATPTIEPAGPRTPAIRFAQVDTTPNYVSWVFSPDDLSSYTIRAYVLFGAGFAAAGQASLARVVNAGETLLSWGVEVTSGGLLRIIDMNGGTAATGTVPLVSGVWYRVELVVNGSSYHVYAFQEEQTTVVDHVTATLPSPVAGGRVRLGNAAGAPQAPAFYVDDLKVTNTAELIGPAATTTLYTDLATLNLQIGAQNTADTVLLNAALEAASRRIDKRCGRRFYADAVATARTINPRGNAVRTDDGDQLLVPDISSLTGLVVEVGTSGGTYTAVTDYETGPDNALADDAAIEWLLRLGSGCWSTGRHGRVRITAKWGWPAVPPEVVEATLLLAARLYKRKSSPDGTAGVGEWGPIRVSKLDPDVESLIGDLILPGFA